MEISLEISFRFIDKGVLLDIFGQVLPKNGCGWEERERRGLGMGWRWAGGIKYNFVRWHMFKRTAFVVRICICD